MPNGVKDAARAKLDGYPRLRCLGRRIYKLYIRGTPYCAGHSVLTA
jgi:hypothetical protein